MAPSVSLWTVLLSGIMSGVVAAYVTYRLSERRETTIFMRQKAEALYANANQWLTGLATIFLYYYPVFKNEASHAEMERATVELMKEDVGEMGNAHRQMTMLTNVYFSDLVPYLDAVHKAREKLNQIISTRKRAERNGDIDLNQFNEFHAATGALLEASKKFEAAIILGSRKIGTNRLEDRIASHVRVGWTRLKAQIAVFPSRRN